MLLFRTVFTKTLRDLRGQVLLWGVGLGTLAAAMVLIYPSFQQGGSIDQLLELFPKPIQALVGDIGSMNVLEGFLRVKLLQPLPLILSVFAVVHCADAIAGEHERRSLDLLLAQPLSRDRVLLEKYGAVMVSVAAIASLIVAGLALGVVVIRADVDMTRLAAAVFLAWPAVAVVGTMALVGSCVFGRARQAAAPAVAYLMAAFFLFTLAPLAPALRPWRWMSVFHYHDAALPIGPGGQPEYALVPLGGAILLLGLAVLALRGRDLRG